MGNNYSDDCPGGIGRRELLKNIAFWGSYVGAMGFVINPWKKPSGGGDASFSLGNGRDDSPCDQYCDLDCHVFCEVGGYCVGCYLNCGMPCEDSCRSLGCPAKSPGDSSDQQSFIFQEFRGARNVNWGQGGMQAHDDELPGTNQEFNAKLKSMNDGVLQSPPPTFFNITS